ncbi:MAG TPA: hypothetical protein VIS52_00380 [Motiliproteus sp.]
MSTVRAGALVMIGLLSGCSLMGQRTPCASDDFVALNACLQQQSAEQLGLAPALRQPYLIYAEKLEQDMALEGLSNAAAIKALAARRQQLLEDPKQAPQCARFAERILCY